MSDLALDLVNKCLDEMETYLDLGKCSLTDKDFLAGTPLDLALRKCTHLKQLVLSNSWRGESKYYSESYSLNKLDDNYFTIDPPALEELKNLKRLECCGNYDKPWALCNMAFVKNLPNLTHINISYNQITKLEGLETLTGLQTFYIIDNQIKKLEGLETLTGVQTFYISDNQITILEGLETLTALQIFNISNNQITKLEGLETLTALQTFNISYNQINKLEGLETLTALQTFVIYRNQITKLEELETLTSLQTFDIYGNQIAKLEGLETLTALQSFKISYSQITKLEGLGTLTDLQTFDISNSQITKLEGLETLAALQTFDISGNLITKLEGLETLTALQKFDIYNNQITDISLLCNPFMTRKKAPLQMVVKESYEIKNGEINVKDNPLTTPPMEVVQQGNDAILYWFAAKDQGKVINHETKLILFGNGKSGKTTLSLQLRKSRFVPLTGKDRTHGIFIETWDIAREDLPETFIQKIGENIREHDMGSPLAMDIPTTFQVKLWDFGGQEYYHATHRLFMSNNIIYLLVWEAATDHQLENEKEEQSMYPVGYWQKNINHFSSNNITLYVQNKVREQASGTDHLHFRVEWRDEKDPISIRRYEADIEVLKKGILEHLATLTYLGKVSPKVYDDIKQALAKLKTPFISYTDYEKLCETNDYTTGSIMQDSAQKETLMRFLDDTGAVVCFRFRKGIDTPALKEHVFTDPVWLTKIIYKILAKGRAEFNQEHVKKIVANDGLDAKLWIEIMKQFELIFEIEKKSGITYVVPQYLPVTCTNQEANDMTLAGKMMEHSFTLNYPQFLPKSNFLRLLAKYGRQNISYLYWQKGLLFFLNNKTVFAECIVTAEERKIVVTIQDRDETAAKEIFEALIAIDEADDLEVSVNEKDFVNVKNLKEKIHRNNTEIDSIKKNTLQVGDFNFLFKNKNEETLKTTHMKKQITIFVSYSSKDRDIRELLVTGLNEHLANRDSVDYHLWTDKEINLGAGWKEDIETALKKSDAALLLISASFVASSFIQTNELAEFLKRKKEDGYLILPVLIRDYNFNAFETLSALNFFKTYFSEYGFNKPLERNKLLPFDVLAEDEKTTNQQLNNYYRKLADYIETAVINHKKDK